ncbi:MAG TPA: Ig-like domain-containing protein, partial [Nitrosopumilaceae archaeon]|nr:Ig-like domain-containing protein [Nitrosopumilaceae archaeon]
GRTIAEPVTITTKFSTILPIESPPQLIVDIPLFINNNFTINPKIIGEGIQDNKYSIDNEEPKVLDKTKLLDSVKNLAEGEHSVKFLVTDTVGHSVSQEFKFVIDNTSPQIIIKSPQNGSIVSGIVKIDLDLDELNPAQKEWLIIKTPKQIFHDVKNVTINTATLLNGNYTIEAIAKDRAENTRSVNILLNVVNPSPNVILNKNNGDQNFIILVEIIVGIAIASTITIITLKKLRISKRS